MTYLSEHPYAFHIVLNFDFYLNELIKVYQKRMKQNTDLFGRENQGVNYDKYRPKYPIKSFEMISNHVSQKKNYLDVGCGTGQMLFKLNSQFEVAVGTDISEKQLIVANQKIEQNNSYKNVKVINSDAHKLRETLQANGLPTFYDLITVGQALHWFDVDRFLEQVYKDVLTQNQESRLAVSGYYWDGFDININNTLISGKEMHEEYYNAIKEFYDFDRENLYTDYNNYNFKKYFELVDYTNVVDRDPFSLEDFIKLLKTSSAYNTLIEKNSTNPQFQDPTTKIEKQIHEKVRNYEKENNQIENTSAFNILKRTYYFIKIFKRI